MAGKDVAFDYLQGAAVAKIGFVGGVKPLIGSYLKNEFWFKIKADTEFKPE